jgi:hypothetical protein
VPAKPDQLNRSTQYFKKENKMKTIITALAMCFALGTAWAQDAKLSENKGEKKEVCTDVKDKTGKVIKNNDGSNKQTCKTIIVRKKYEATTVPGQK